jgi:ribonucleoside-triphosphate reductase
MSLQARSDLLISRTYAREKDDGTKETWEEIVSRVIGHQRWLWEGAQHRELSETQLHELDELKQLLLERKGSLSGRTLWLGGTETAKKRAASNFNCSFSKVETVHDVVDCLWLLMQGCGVGFRPVVGSLSGFSHKINSIRIIRSERKREEWPENRGRESNIAYERDNSVYYLSVGDSAEAWAKSVGKLLAYKGRAKEIVIDLSEIRPAGIRLKGYGWISSGDQTLSIAMDAISKLLNQAAGRLLTRIEILDLMNWLGTVLSSRRSAEIALFSVDEPEWQEFATAKREYWVNNPQRAQSNNSLLFNRKPQRSELEHIFNLMLEGGGCEPGFINGETALKRAPWFAGINPCAN